MAINFNSNSELSKSKHYHFIPVFLILICGCSEVLHVSAKAVGIERTFHQKMGLKAESYFTDPKVIELCKAIEVNDLAQMDKLIAEGVNVNARGEGNVTPLFWAFPDNKIERFTKLLEAGADPNVQITSNLGLPRVFGVNDSVTHLVAKTWFPKYFETTVEHGLDPYIKDSLGGDVVLSLIVHGGPSLINRFKLLLKHGWDINHTGWSGDNALLTSIQYERYSLALFLLENGADYNYYNPTTNVKAIHQLIPVQGGLYPRPPSPPTPEYLKVLKWLEDHGQDATLAAATIKLPDPSEGPKGQRAYTARKLAARLADETARGVKTKTGDSLPPLVTEP
jgi:uncharacterized protein